MNFGNHFIDLSWITPKKIKNLQKNLRKRKISRCLSLLKNRMCKSSLKIWFIESLNSKYTLILDNKMNRIGVQLEIFCDRIKNGESSQRNYVNQRNSTAT